MGNELRKRPLLWTHLRLDENNKSIKRLFSAASYLVNSFFPLAVANSYLKCVKVASRFVLIHPRRIKICSWWNELIASSEPLSFDDCRIGYFCRSVSNLYTLSGFENQSMQSPFPILSTIVLILSMPYSPQANSTTENVKKHTHILMVQFNWILWVAIFQPIISFRHGIYLDSDKFEAK